MKPTARFISTTVAAMGLFVAACAGPGAPTAPSPTSGAAAAMPVPTLPASPPPATSTTVLPTPSPAGTPAASPTITESTVLSTETAIVSPLSTRYDVVNGTEADFRVREQLARLSFPSDAIGKTSAITGSIVLGPDGKVVPDQSKFVVDLTTLKSDSNGRDGFIKRNTIDVASYPSAEFVITEVQGLPSPLPTSGKQSFKLVGNLTIHGVTHPATWTVDGDVNGNDVTGLATTNFKFEDFGMSPPKAGPVLSVVDDVKLELNFHLAKSSS
jgi:polyisoprenoid-binding protein YceI